VQQESLPDTLVLHLHLNWRYAEASATDDAPVIPLPPEKLVRLERFVNEGPIIEVQVLADRLEQTDEICVPAARYLRHLTQGFDMDRLKELIVQWMKENHDQ
jgi:hypothetical protein